MTESKQNTSRQSVDVLRRGGLMNPRRAVALMRESIEFLELNLSGFTVLTEAASGQFVVTPVIAGMAGANRVIAVTRESRFATAQDVITQTRALESLAGLQHPVEIRTDKTASLFAEADIVTNLGFVRPISAEAVAAMKPSCVVSLMCETWEVREGDVDLDACRRHGVAALGTNEDYPGLEVFSYNGPLCLKMLLEAQVEILKSRIVVVSSDKFGRAIAAYLSGAGANVRLVAALDVQGETAGADAVVVADYTRDDLIIGISGDISAGDLARSAPGAVLVQFAGRVDVPGLQASGVSVFPGLDLPSHRMAVTLAALGPRPAIELHAAGLKVGETMARFAIAGLRGRDVEAAAIAATPLAQGWPHPTSGLNRRRESPQASL